MSRNIKEYIGTIIVSILIATCFCFVIELELLFRTEKNVAFNQMKVQNFTKFCTIEELERKLALHPDDYYLNIRLGQLYESINQLDKANDYYKNALKISGRSNFTVYSYAIFCAKNDLYVFAATLAEELDGNSKRINTFKARIYEEIADSLDRKGDYPAAVKSYQIVYKYAKSIGDLKYINQIKNKYAQEFIKLADYNIKNKEIDVAISNLKNSLQLKETPQANYKLGLIYIDTDLELAEKHINKAIFKDAFVVNPYIYNSVLEKLMNQYKILGSESHINYYSSRMSRFKTLLNKVYLYKNQILIDNSAILQTKTFFGKIKKVLFFEMKNNTDVDINELYIKAEIYVNGKKFIVEDRIANKNNILHSFDLMEVQLKLADKINFNNLSQNNDIFVRYFAKKKENAPWILVKIDFINI